MIVDIMTVLNSNLKTFSLMLIIASYSYICYLTISHNTYIIKPFFFLNKKVLSIYLTLSAIVRMA